MRLSRKEKVEILQDAQSKSRKENIEAIKKYPRFSSVEESIDWIQQLNDIFKMKTEKRFVKYKNVKI